MAEKEFSISGLLSDLGDAVSDEAKKVLQEYEQEVKDIGKFTFYEIVKMISEDDERELNTTVQTHLLMSLSDEDLLKAKKDKIKAAKELADLIVKRKKIVGELLTKVGKKMATIILQYMLIAV